MEIVKVIIAGLAIGILISAPMGPIGMLCIQRTLNKGRASGFFTGVGAAFSDLLYSLLTGFGLSFVINFIEKNQTVLQIFGSVVLLGFGVYIARKNPAKNDKGKEGTSGEKQLCSGFDYRFLVHVLQSVDNFPYNRIVCTI